jgi:WhiB family redox-sensing transcriptional regulator
VTSWHENAACRKVSPDLFFPEGATNIDAAKALCQSCEVRPDCLDFALTTGQEYGIWGGLEPSERKRRKKYLVVACNRCGRTFVWPIEGGQRPRFCSAVCLRAARAATRQRSYQRRQVEATG